jgi:hypothetical protein
MDNLGIGVRCRRGKELFLFTITYRPSLGLTQPSIQLVPAAVFATVKRLGLEADHSPQFSAEVKKGGGVPQLPHMFSLSDD